MELKARRLLPGREDIELDEELLRFEERDLLLARLLECKTFQDAAQVLHARIAEAASASRAPPAPKSRSARWRPIRSNASPLDALLAAARARARAEGRAGGRTDHVAPIRASVRDAIETVLALLPDVGHDQLPRPRAGAGAKLEVIVRFLAVLELFKQGVVDLEQVENFGDLVVRPLASGERVALDLSSLDEWGDEPRSISTTRADRESPTSRSRCEARRDRRRGDGGRAEVSDDEREVAARSKRW